MAGLGKIYLIPNFIGDEEIENSFPQENQNIIQSLSLFFVEREKSSRSFLSKMNHPLSFDEIKLKELPKKKSKGSIGYEWLQSLLNGQNAGLISEAGMPAVADPGENLIMLAHEMGIEIKPLVGPSSILLALASSGLNGESFSFHGYLPIDKKEKSRKIKFLEGLSRNQEQTQIFMETPYRNNQMIDDLIKICSPSTKLCLAANLNTSKSYIKTKSIEEWKSSKPNLNKVPCIFLLGI